MSSNQIFSEIMSGMGLPLEDIEKVKFHFYSYFRQDVHLYKEVKETLKRLSDQGILLGTLSDVAYGMDNVYALEDISEVIKYIDHPLTSNDVGVSETPRGGTETPVRKNAHPCGGNGICR